MRKTTGGGPFGPPSGARVNGKSYVADTIRVQTPSFHGECCCAVDLISTIASHGEEKRVTCLTSCDPSKAFDSVDRNELFKKLGWYAGAQPGGGVKGVS